MYVLCVYVCMYSAFSGCLCSKPHHSFLIIVQISHPLISALAIRICFVLIARAALWIDIIAVSLPRSPKSVRKQYQGVMCI